MTEDAITWAHRQALLDLDRAKAKAEDAERRAATWKARWANAAGEAEHLRAAVDAFAVNGDTFALLAALDPPTA